jgi:hypothetical protein
MAAISPATSLATYPGICFYRGALSPKTKFEITKDSVSFYDPVDGCRHTFAGGSDKYSIIITDSGTKKRPYKNITIKLLMPLCPLSGLPVIEAEMASSIEDSVYEKSPDRGIQFWRGYAYNCYRVELRAHSKFDLQPVFYCKIGIHRATTCDIYLVVPIVDGRIMQPAQMDALMDSLGNMDVVNIISGYYNQLSANDFNFHMADIPIKPGTLYHKYGLVDLLLQGKLKLGIINDDFIGLHGYNRSILILEPDAYNHVSPYGTVSVLKYMFKNCQTMMNFRQMLIEKHLV